MTDIVERLRAGATMFQNFGNEEEELAQAATEAADEIERLRIQVKQADERGDDALRRAHAGEVVIERLRVKLDQQTLRADAEAEAGKRLRAERDSLVEKLRLACERGDVADAERDALRKLLDEVRPIVAETQTFDGHAIDTPTFLLARIDAARKGER